MRFFVFIFFFFFTVSQVYANMVITEIMYDVEGADTGREWVEIQNTGTAVDLTGWKFFENGVNHGLTLAQGNIMFPQNGFAVIADNTEKFLLDWSGFQGTLFDSSFSFSNTGEILILRDAGLADIDSVAYSSDLGATGDGNSLQKVSGKWVSALPTPGLEHTEKINENNTLEPRSSLEVISSGSTQEPKPSPFQAFAGNDRSALSGAEVYFEGQVKGIDENLVSKVRFLWNFGDGIAGEGKSIKHVFQYPGSYIVGFNVSFGTYSDSDSIKVSVSEAGIYISEIKPGGWIEVKNESTKIADVSGFSLQINDSKIFNFPKDTKLAAGSFLTLDSLTLGLEIPDAGDIKILYSNGKTLFSSKYQVGFLGEKESISFDGDSPAGGWVKSEATPGAKNSIKKDSIQQEKITSSPTPSLLGVKEVENENGVTEVIESGQASVVNSQTNISFWSEIKWLIFGLGIGVVAGVIYLFLRRHFKLVSAL